MELALVLWVLMIAKSEHESEHMLGNRLGNTSLVRLLEL